MTETEKELLALIGAIVTTILISDLRDEAPKLAEGLIKRAVQRHAPPEDSEDLEDELLSVIEGIEAASPSSSARSGLPYSFRGRSVLGRESRCHTSNSDSG